MIVLIQGPPGSGKTSVGKFLSEYLKAIYFSKDDVKEILFDSIGFKDKMWSRQLGVASNNILFSLIERVATTGQSIVIETNLTLRNDVDRMYELLRPIAHEVIEIYLYAEKDVLMKRVKARWESGDRHEGHSDNMRYKDIEEYIDNKVSKPINIGNNKIKLDTTNLSISELENEIKKQLDVSGGA